MYTTEMRSDFPHQVVAIIVTLSLSESDESSESQRNKDVFTVTMSDDLLASQLYQYHPSLSLRLRRLEIVLRLDCQQIVTH